MKHQGRRGAAEGGRARRRVGGSLVAAFAVVWVAVAPAACSGGGEAAPPPPSRPEVVVASFNFPESRLLAEIYAGALEAAGIPVRRELDLGPRELVTPALREGLVDVVPEYLGSGLRSAVAGAPVDLSGTDAAHRELQRVARQWGFRALTPAPAENQNGLAVTSGTAERLGARTIGDLAAAAPALALGGPPECPSRPFCLEGFERVYGLRFGRFMPFATGEQRATALVEGVVDVAVVFTTDANLATGDLVLLADDRGLQPPENVVPIVSDRAIERYGRGVETALNAVSARLTTEGLRFLNWRIVVGGKDVAAEAQGWLDRHALLAPRG